MIEASLNDAVGNAAGMELGAGLRDDFAAMRQHQHVAILRNRLLDDRAGDHRLAAAGRRNQHDAALTGSTGALKISDHIVLVWAQFGVWFRTKMFIDLDGE